MDTALISLIVIVALALAFDFINGFHDTANAIATSVATRVLTPAQAIAMSAILNVVGALMGTHVAKTVSKDIVSQDYATLELVGAALVSAITWNLFTWWKGLPSSSSHALIFSLVGAGVAAGGWGIIIPKGVKKTLMGLVYSPALGFIIPIILMFLLSWLVLRYMKPRAVTSPVRPTGAGTRSPRRRARVAGARARARSCRGARSRAAARRPGRPRRRR